MFNVLVTYTLNNEIVKYNTYHYIEDQDQLFYFFIFMYKLAIFP